MTGYEKRSRLRDLAHQLKLALDACSPYIQQMTSEVCPACEKVCCVNRHGYYDDNDLIYVRALGLELPSYRGGMSDTDPCQFLSDSGCTRERSARPFRCNWYFCNALIEHMEEEPARPYREFISAFQRVVELRGKMLKEFYGEKRLSL